MLRLFKKSLWMVCDWFAESLGGFYLSQTQSGRLDVSILTLSACDINILSKILKIKVRLSLVRRVGSASSVGFCDWSWWCQGHSFSSWMGLCCILGGVVILHAWRAGFLYDTFSYSWL